MIEFEVIIVRLALVNFGNHQIVDIRLPNIEDYNTLVSKILNPEASMDLIKTFDGSDVIVNLSNVWYAYRLGNSWTTQPGTIQLGGV